MATYNKYDPFVLALVNGVHDFDAHVFKVALTNTTPVVTHAALASASELPTAGGYTAGGIAVTIATSSSGSGPATAKVATSTDPLWTGVAGFTFSHAILFNDTPTSPVADPLISYWAYGSSQTVGLNETLTVDFDPSPGIFTVT